VKKYFPAKAIVVSSVAVLVLIATSFAQEFEINGGKTAPSPKSPATRKSGKKGAASESSGFGWGSSIEVGRLGRAAESALARGNYSAAADYAQRALNEAPNNPRLWFLLGYAARLAGKGQTSIDAYQHGLQMQPGSVEGLSGLAQTYMRMGRMDDAKKILLQVIAANPRRPDDLMMAGELFLKSGDYQRAAGLLERAESLKPNSHAEVMLAQSYMHLNEPDKAQAVLNKAKARSPRNPDVFRAVADFYREQRDYKDAIATLNEVPNKTPEVLGELGYTYQLAGMKQESADAYVKAATLAPGDLAMQLGAASALEQNGDIPAAEKYLAIAEKLDANNYRLHAIRADIARIQNRTQDAIQEYNIALANLPDSVPEGPLYPVQLRLNLSEQYRDAGEEGAATQQIKIAEDQINRLQVQGAMRAEFLRMRASIEAAGNNFTAAEKDLKEARKIDPTNINIIIQYAAMLWRMKRGDEARALYSQALQQDPKNKFALISLGYLARENGDNKTAEEFFKRLQQAYPNDHDAYVALGDLYTAERQFEKAQANYEEGYKFAPSNALIIAGGANAAIEAHDIPLAGKWLARAKGSMLKDPRVMVEEERYLFHKGNYLESARIGEKTVKLLPTNRDASVYLAYDYYNLGRYDDALRLVREKELVMPKEPNFPLLAGHIQKQADLLSEAVEDYTRALSVDPTMVEAYINRGYVRNDLQDADQAVDDFNYVLKKQPNNGIAQLGIAFSYLELKKGKLALEHANEAQKLLGESGSTHLARATAYRQMRLLSDAEKEYRAALKFAPDDLTLHLALADTLYYERKYADSVTALNDALRLSPDDALIFAEMAHAHAKLHQRDETLRYVRAAEAQEPNSSAILLATGDALMTLGEEHAAMQRFERALDAPDANRVDARLNIAQLFMHQGKWDDARQQISLAFAESRIGEASAVTTDNLIEAANLFLGMHDFDLAQRYFEGARKAGAADEVVAIGLANTYLAQGNSQAAQVQLASVSSDPDINDDYDYMMAMANLYRQRHEDLQALTMFARANEVAGEDDTAERNLQQMAGDEGIQLNKKVSVATDLQVAPIYEDETIYITDARLFGSPADKATLPPPRSSIETRWTNFYRVHEGSWPTISGYFQLRNARGQISLPSIGTIVNRDTYDYVFNGALNPVLHIGGRNLLQFNTGVQATVRRDRESPVDMNQNLFRQFAYMTSSPFGNWLSVSGSLIHESGPFTEMSLTSRELVGNIEFTIGRPWGKTALITGYTGRDLQFHGNPSGGPALPNSLFSEFYSTSSYIGVQRKFSDKFRMSVMAEYMRVWRTQLNDYATAQMMRPAFEFEYKFNKRWGLEGSFASSRGMGIHDYDNVQSGLLISYVKPLKRLLNGGNGALPIEYPLRFSFGFQQENFYNFTGRGQTTILRPIVRLTLF
jgi:tetratricopeptide (TPR) repeat protein